MLIIPEIALEDDVDIEKIPDAVPRGDFKPLVLDTSSNSSFTFVVVDLETTDLSKLHLLCFIIIVIMAH